LYVFEKFIITLIYLIIIPILMVNIFLIFKTVIEPNKTPDFFGFKTFVIISKSMEDTIMTGDAIVVKEVNQENLKVNDIISFIDGDSINTHRIIKITEKNGENIYTTKGDNNKFEDKNKITFDKIEGKCILRIKKFGKIVSFIKNKLTLIFLLIVLILVSLYQARINKRRLNRKIKKAEYEKNNKI
ncbi:MAG: signal peptidase I, partial [Clostridia bacterium]|nr:signal peptidase I [Clostridia bacterium]